MDWVSVLLKLCKNISISCDLKFDLAFTGILTALSCQPNQWARHVPKSEQDNDKNNTEYFKSENNFLNV